MTQLALAQTPTWKTFNGVEVAVVQGDGACPAGAVPMEPELAKALHRFRNAGFCDMLGDWGMARLAKGGVMGGKRYQCEAHASYPNALTSTLCVKHEKGPCPTGRYRREVYPGADDLVLVFLAEKLDANATDLATVYISFKKAPSGWPDLRMIWDKPPGGGPVWVPDGNTQFQLKKIASLNASQLPALSGSHKVFENHDPAHWTPASNPVAPQYLISEVQNIGMNVLPDGTMRFVAAQVPTNTGRVIMDKNTRPATFIVNTHVQGVVIKGGWYVDDRPL
jgi:hypothetical protein